MDPVALTLGIAWTCVGLLCVGLAIPLVRGQVGRNAFYGVRLPESFQSDEAWFAINRFGGKQLIVWSLPLLVVGIVSFFLPLRGRTGLTLMLGFVPLLFILIPAVQVWRFARRYRTRV